MLLKKSYEKSGNIKVFFSKYQIGYMGTYLSFSSVILWVIILGISMTEAIHTLPNNKESLIMACFVLKFEVGVFIIK